MKNLYYISPRDLRKNRSDAVHIVLTCDAFAKMGLAVSIITPQVRREEYKVSYNDIFSLYGIQESFKIVELPTRLSEGKNYESKSANIAFQKFFKHLQFAWKNRKSLSQKDAVIFSKCFISTVPYILYRKIGLIKAPIIFETITPKNTFLHRFIFKNCNFIVSHTKYVSEHILEYASVSTDKIHLASVPLQTWDFDSIPETREEIRKSLGFFINEQYVVYAGKTGKNILAADYFIDCAKLLPDIKFAIVGANSKAEKEYQERIVNENINNLLIYPFQTLTNYYRFVKAADILVAYYSASKHNMYHLSPGKSGVYFGSKNPVIFSDLPSLRSLFPEEILYYVKPDNPKLLAEQIKNVMSDTDEAAQKTTAALEFSNENDYQNFCYRILEFIQTRY
jgi:glycosyltransferase involved in cell wall biosynthesis